MGNTRKPFALTREEAAALEAARAQFEDWHGPLQPFRPKVLADIREAARALHAALEPVLNTHLNTTAHRLLLRMQQVELHQHGQDHYRQMLTMTSYAAGLIYAACAADVQRGQKPDELAHTWVRTAANYWLRAGLTLDAGRGRFGRALLHSPPPRGVGQVGQSQIVAALADAQELSTATPTRK